jgi:hypothetical protein
MNVFGMSKAPKERPQIEKFREAARELECDESESQFDSTLRDMVKPGGGGSGQPNAGGHPDRAGKIESPAKK